MLALMKPSTVATRSRTRGTSCGATVVTRTSGAFGGACAGLREQPVEIVAMISSVPRTVTCFVAPLLVPIRGSVVSESLLLLLTLHSACQSFYSQLALRLSRHVAVQSSEVRYTKPKSYLPIDRRSPRCDGIFICAIHEALKRSAEAKQAKRRRFFNGRGA